MELHLCRHTQLLPVLEINSVLNPTLLPPAGSASSKHRGQAPQTLEVVVGRVWNMKAKINVL
jgi:hypothetical protein